jgi:hypothetical protein
VSRCQLLGLVAPLEKMQVAAKDLQKYVCFCYSDLLHNLLLANKDTSDKRDRESIFCVSKLTKHTIQML